MIINNKIRSPLERIQQILKLLLSMVVARVEDLEPGYPIPKWFLSRFIKRVATRGLWESLLYYKEIRTIFHKRISDPVFREKGKIPCTKDGGPKALGPMIPLIRTGKPIHLRLANTFLVIGRCFRIKGPVDLSSITKPHLSPMDYSIWVEVADKFVRQYDLFPDRERPQHRFRMSAGPNGPAMTSLVHDAKSLTPAMLAQLRTLSDNRTIEEIEKIRGYPDHLLQTTSRELGASLCYNTRRLSAVCDKEGKMRIVAIFDYWSQFVLRPYHKELNGFLKSIKGDCTFNQGKFTKIIKNDGAWKGSLDLKSATDRIPVELQRILFESIGGHDKSQAWKSLMVDYEFVNPGGDPVAYATGQPMGAYSSFPMMALTHHMIVYKSALDIKAKRGTYSLLGDDIVLSGQRIINAYRRNCDILGIEISLPKTMLSRDTWEFAKRLFHHGEEITHFPIGELLEGLRSGWTVVYSLENAEGKGGSFRVFSKEDLFRFFRIRCRSNRSAKSMAAKAYRFRNRLVPERLDETILPALKGGYDLSPGSFPCSMTVESAKAFLGPFYMKAFMDTLVESNHKSKASFLEVSKWEAFKSSPKEFGRKHPTLEILEGIGLRRNAAFELLGTEFKRGKGLGDIINDTDVVDFHPIPTDIRTINSLHSHDLRWRMKADLNSKFELVLKEYHTVVDKLLRQPPH